MHDLYFYTDLVLLLQSTSSASTLYTLTSFQHSVFPPEQMLLLNIRFLVFKFFRPSGKAPGPGGSGSDAPFFTSRAVSGEVIVKVGVSGRGLTLYMRGSESSEKRRRRGGEEAANFCLWSVLLVQPAGAHVLSSDKRSKFSWTLLLIYRSGYRTGFFLFLHQISKVGHESLSLL